MDMVCRWRVIITKPIEKIMDNLVEFRRPDGSTYFAKFPENEKDVLVLEPVDVAAVQTKVSTFKYILGGLLIWWLLKGKK